jgi:hypothetical protein
MFEWPARAFPRDLTSPQLFNQCPRSNPLAGLNSARLLLEAGGRHLGYWTFIYPVNPASSLDCISIPAQLHGVAFTSGQNKSFLASGLLADTRCNKILMPETYVLSVSDTWHSIYPRNE